MSGGGQSGSDGQDPDYSVPVNGSVSMTLPSTSTQGSAAITTYVWASNGTPICGNSSTCTAPFGTPSNTITLTVTDSNSTRRQPPASEYHATRRDHGALQHERRRAERERRADPDLQRAGEWQREHDLTSTSTQGSAAITSYVWASNGTPICGNSSTARPRRDAEQHDHIDGDGQQQQHVDSTAK